MRRTLMLLGFAALFMLPTTWTDVQAQSVEIRNFAGLVHPLRKIVRLIWWASEDSTLLSFGIERSTDGINFTQIGDVPALLTGEDGHIYEFWDPTASLGVNYYRLDLMFVDGSMKPTEAITVDVGRPPIYSYPTLPTRPGSGLVTPFDGDPDNTWLEARVLDLYGRPVTAVNGQQQITLPDDLPSGIYVLQARYATGWESTTFVVTQTD